MPDAPFSTGILFIKTRDHNGNDLVAYYQHNHLQAPLQAIDKQGNIRWAAQYTAFGQTSIISSGDSAINSNLRLPGQYADSESGLYYNWQRYYDANTGRYISSDPIGLAGGLNRYAYVEGNPIGWVDPSGLKVLNPNNYPVSAEVMKALKELNRLIGCDKDIVITGGDRPKDASIGAGSNSTHTEGKAADIVVPGQKHIETANQASKSNLFGGVGWYEEGYRGPRGEGPHTHVDIRENGPARWGFPAEGERIRGRIPNYDVELNKNNCGCEE